MIFDITVRINTEDHGPGTFSVMVGGGCPSQFGLECDEYCNTKNNCWICWEEALKRGVKSGAKFIHLRRLD